jgi:hypothetical protein
MSKLRRPFLYDRYIFVTVNLLRSRRKLEESDFRRLAIARACAPPNSRAGAGWPLTAHPAGAGPADEKARI